MGKDLAQILAFLFFSILYSFVFVLSAFCMYLKNMKLSFVSSPLFESEFNDSVHKVEWMMIIRFYV